MVTLNFFIWPGTSSLSRWWDIKAKKGSLEPFEIRNEKDELQTGSQQAFIFMHICQMRPYFNIRVLWTTWTLNWPSYKSWNPFPFHWVYRHTCRKQRCSWHKKYGHNDNISVQNATWRFTRPAFTLRPFFPLLKFQPDRCNLGLIMFLVYCDAFYTSLPYYSQALKLLKVVNSGGHRERWVDEAPRVLVERLSWILWITKEKKAEALQFQPHFMKHCRRTVSLYVGVKKNG